MWWVFGFLCFLRWWLQYFVDNPLVSLCLIFFCSTSISSHLQLHLILLSPIIDMVGENNCNLYRSWPPPSTDLVSRGRSRQATPTSNLVIFPILESFICVGKNAWMPYFSDACCSKFGCGESDETWRSWPVTVGKWCFLLRGYSCTLKYGVVLTLKGRKKKLKKL